MKKLTQKEKIVKAILFAQSIKSSAGRLKFYSEDLDFNTGVNSANEIIKECDEFLELLR